MIYAPLLRADQLALPSSDMIAPTLIHDKFIGSMASGQDFTFEATVTDNVRIHSVNLYYRPKNTQEYKHLPMQHLKDSYIYAVTLDKRQLNAPGIEYYIEAVDMAGNRLTSGYAMSPLLVNVSQRPNQLINTSTVPKLEPIEESSANKWLWIGLGVLALAALAGGGGGGGSASATGPAASGSRVVVTVPVP